MSNKVFKPGRCLRCGKRREDEVHDLRRTGVLAALRRLFAGGDGGGHQFADRDTMVAARDGMAETERWAKRARRRG